MSNKEKESLKNVPTKLKLFFVATTPVKLIIFFSALKHNDRYPSG